MDKRDKDSATGRADAPRTLGQLRMEQGGTAQTRDGASKASKGLAIVLILAVILLLWFFFFKPSGDKGVRSTTTSDTQSSVTSGTAAPPTAEQRQVCSAEAMAQTDEMTFMQRCLAAVNDDTATILEVIQGAKAAGQCNIAQRLYLHRGHEGDVTIAVAYAQEYDPATHQANPCFEPDVEAALYWYETALESAPNHAVAKTRYEELSQ